MVPQPPIFVGWKIYYTDGTTFSSKDGAIGQAPRINVQIITVFYSKVTDDSAHTDFGRNYRKMWHGSDFYWIRPGQDGNPPDFGMTNRPQDIPEQVTTFDSGPYIEWEPFLKAAYEDWDWDVA